MRTLADALENAGCLRLDGSATTRPVQPAGA
jgi:hypothetical protein